MIHSHSEIERRWRELSEDERDGFRDRAENESIIAARMTDRDFWCMHRYADEIHGGVGIPPAQAGMEF